ncbi:hypothetical protein BT69DRAFT_1333300 [Atractiella rhizophila]|nr:hypothetical protein BT69DRAFT_1333300 [Atractiella rhizophila]
MADLEMLAELENMKLQDTSRELDLVFVLDCTGSMGSYITSATQNIEVICQEIVQSEKLASPDCLRIGLIAYRDHPPQDTSYITKNFGFGKGSDVASIKKQLQSLYASGGGDGPEAVTAALKETLLMDWRPSASKIAVLIADAPPHGIGEYGDAFADGSPEGSDPLILAREMATRGITLFCVACEPALSGYSYALDHFRALSDITSGVLLPLTTAALLAHVIVGSALEQLDMERLIREVGETIAQKIHQGQESVDDVARQLHETLLLRNESTKQLRVEDIYRDTPESRHNVQTYINAPDLATARTQLKRVPGSRLTQKFLDSRYSSRGHLSLYPAPGPLRPPKPDAYKKARVERHKLNVDPKMTFLGSTTPTKSSADYGAMRDGSSPLSGFDMDDDDDRMEEDAEPFDDDPNSEKDTQIIAQDVQGQQIHFGRDPITFEQAKRITSSAAWRAFRASS